MDKDLTKICYDLFERSGNIGYYMLMHRLTVGDNGKD